MTDLQALKAATTRMSTRDSEFAKSLIYQHASKGKLSDKQWFWVRELVKRVDEPKQEGPKVGDLSGVMALFDRARKHLKSPAIVLQVGGIGEVRVSVAGDRARVPGSLNVAVNNHGDWFGRVLKDGTFEKNRKVDVPASLVPALERFAASPAEVAAEHGKLTGKCCFCNTALTDERSTAVGYGPSCAKNYGLPYGKKAAKPVSTVNEAEMALA